MKWILFGCVLGVVFVLFLLFFPFLASVYFDFDAKKKVGNYCIKFCGIKIIFGYAKFDGLKIEFFNERAWFIGNKKMSEILPVFAYILFTALDVFSVDIRFEIGDKNSPALAGFVSGFTLVAMDCLYGYFKTKNNNASFKKQILFLVDRDALGLEFNSFIGISMFNVFKSLIFARIEQGKSVQTKAEVKK